MRFANHAWLVLTAAVLAAGPAASAKEDAIHRTVVDGVEINLWMPGSVKALRGAFVDPANAKVGSDAEDASANVWEETCRNLDCGHVGMILQNMNRGNRPAILQKALAAALKEFADKSGHPEIEHMPLAFSGMSKGGGWSASTAYRMPERAVAYANVVGWVADSKGSDAQLQVPGLFIIGGVPDDFKMLDAVAKDYDPGRQRGAPWTLALQWGAAHDWNNASALVLPYLDAMFRARVPADVPTAGTPAKLKPVRLEDGWLGDRATWDSHFPTVAPWADYKGDKASAVWLPNRAIAMLWRAFESKDPPVRIDAATADGKARLPEGKKRRMVVEAGATIVLQAAVNAGTDVRKVRFYAGDQALGEVTEAPWRAEWKSAPPRPHGVFAEWESASGKSGVSNPALVVVRKPAAASGPAATVEAPTTTTSTSFADPGHPFILWTKAEAAAIRRRIDTEPWAKPQYEAMLKEKGNGQTFRNLFRYQVMGDESVVDAEKKYLVSLIGNDPRKFLGDTGGGRHYDQYLSVLRYDVLYDRLSGPQRQGLEDTFRDFIRHHCEEETLRFTRTSWLPNMQWPRPMTAHLMAVALRDEKLVRQCFNSRGGWRYYFDDYLGDGRFYFEEFGKQYSMMGEMFLWCRGVERLGLDELGYGYTGKGGATMRRYVESIVDIGYPRVEIPGGLPHYPQITMGDARGSGFPGAPPYVFQKSIVMGYLPGGAGGNPCWMAANMNGRDHKNTKVDKMLHPLWFELARAKWPDGHFDYFLAQMRGPGEAIYTPSLFWGLGPINPKQATPPPAPSYVARERGFALLRSDESPSYWEGEAPAVALQLATYYVHYTHDCFSLLGFYAFNRPIYLNRQISNGYGGGCPWTDSARGHCGVMVDGVQYLLNDADPKQDYAHWPNPVGDVPVRSGFDPLVKFVAARARPVGGTVSLDNRQPLAGGTLSLDLRRQEPEVWPGVDMTRALFLTRQYLCDFHQLTSNRPRRYDWRVHALGQFQADPAWKPTDELTDRLYDTSNRAIARLLSDPVERDRYQLKDVVRLNASEQPFNATVVQTCALPDAATSVLGKAWYDRRIGVRVHMLGEPGTVAYAGRSPVSRSQPGKEQNKGERSELLNEVGGTTLLVSRTAPATVFAALHEPFKDGRPVVETFRRIQQTAEGIAVAVQGRTESPINDRILVRFGDGYEQSLTLAGDGESFTFADRAYVRVGPDRVDVSGDLRAMTIRVSGKPGLFVNGQRQEARVLDGRLVFGK
jgi:hypothetical protein